VLEYKEKTVLEVAACTCDRCRRHMTADDLDWYERVSLAYRGGFGSILATVVRYRSVPAMRQGDARRLAAD
jgi:hypothetical protein